MKKLLILIKGWLRLHPWGFCPNCNLDAPEVYDCEVCREKSSFTERYVPRRDTANRSEKKKWWKRFKAINK